PRRDKQTAVDVVRDFARGKRLQLEASGDSLVQLPHFGLAKHIVEVRLADQDNLQQLGLVGFEVRKQTDLLEDARTEMLRLVNHDDGMRVQRDQRGEELLQRRNQLMARDVGQRLASARIAGGDEPEIGKDAM